MVDIGKCEYEHEIPEKCNKKPQNIKHLSPVWGSCKNYQLIEPVFPPLNQRTTYGLNLLSVESCRSPSHHTQHAGNWHRGYLPYSELHQVGAAFLDTEEIRHTSIHIYIPELSKTVRFSDKKVRHLYSTQSNLSPCPKCDNESSRRLIHCISRVPTKGRLKGA